MKRSLRRVARQAGATLVELVVTMSVSIIVLGVLTYASVGLTRSMNGTEQYMIGVANTNRILDAISVDLRRAVRVSLLSGASTIPIKDTGSTTYTITDSNILVINIPDYYGSNTRNNSAGSAYKTTRYPRPMLNTSSTYNGSANPLLKGIVPWAEAQTTVNGVAVTRYAPTTAGTGEIQIRYSTGPRSAGDATPCFFRSEYPSGATTPSSIQEIAARISDSTSTTSVTISGRNAGQTFRLQSSFSPRFRSTGAPPPENTAVVEVSTRNPRRD
jgi:type II secretory pathway pseudopilin PulG